MSSVLQGSALASEPGFCGLVGRHPTMRALFDRMRRAAAQQMPVLIVGETGTGKELVARGLHQLSGARGAWMPLNVALLSDQLAEAELFGTVRGAFTGAVDRVGLIEAASGGTLFLDEASELSRDLQLRLLRILESYSVRRLGGRQEYPVRFRLLLSLQRPAASLVAGGAWRDDFCHRVNGITLGLPPLRDRLEDVPLLVNHILARFGRAPVPSGALDALCDYPWPGNVRELIRVVERAMFAADDGPVTVGHLEAETWHAAQEGASAVEGSERPARSEERAYIEKTLRELGSTKAAAQVLGLSIDQLYRRFRVLGITAPRLR
jgi:DNA-binding NtrC family response regulator